MQIKSWPLVVALSVTWLSLSPLPSQAAPVDNPAGQNPTSSLIVTFDNTQPNPEAAASQAISSVAEQVAGAKVSQVVPISDTSAEVKLTTELNSAQVASISTRVEQQAGVQTAEASMTFQAAEANYEPNQWNINTWVNKYGTKASTAWARTNGTSSIVGVVDSGITAHPDLTGSGTEIVGGNVVAGYDFITDSTSAGDGNGPDPSPSDEGDLADQGTSTWHGTHVSGIVAAIQNSSGVVGVAPGAKVEPLRVLGRDGAETADIARAIRWGAGLSVPGMSANPNPVGVLNISLGGYGTCPAALQSAINAAVAKGVPVVVAAGNQSMPLASSAPANCSNTIRVTATTGSGRKASFSNFGTSSTPATIAAPGTGITSTVNLGPTTPAEPGYAQMSGTSMAAPHVAGVIALLKAQHPRWSVGQLTAALQVTATPAICSANGCGAGIVNADAATKLIGFFYRQASPRVSGTYRAGKTLRTSIGTWSPGPTVRTYQWLRNGKTIGKATKSSYKLTKKDRRAKISVRVTVRRAGFVPATGVSTAKKVTR